ncbi:MAG TPA: hypothetical protein VLE03_03815, partial [Nitrospiraceae bacterium]|nr:hypothetical protein [Nitrospiraceae bacterium]
SDGDCTTRSNNVTKMVKFGDDSITPPTVFATGVVPSQDDQVFNLTTGGLTHIFLVDTANSNTLKVLDVATGILTTVLANVGEVRIVAQDTSNRVFLMSNSKLYLYTISTTILTELVSATGSSFLLKGNDFTADSTHLYVVDATPGAVKKIPLSATGPGDVINHYTAPASVLEMQLSENRLVLRVSSNPCNPVTPGSEGLVSVRKDNGTTVSTLVPVAANTCVFGSRPEGSNVFYTKFAGGTQTAHVVTEDGTAVLSPITGGNWGAGEAGFTSFNPRTGDGVSAKIILLTSSTLGTVNGASVSVYDWATPTNTPLVAGTIPSTAVPLNFVNFFGDTTAALGLGFSNQTPNTEIFFLDSAISNSLVRVPTPNAAQWFPVE